MSNYEWFPVDRLDDPASKWETFTRPIGTNIAPYMWRLTQPIDGSGRFCLVMGVKDPTSPQFRWLAMSVYADVSHAKRGAEKAFHFLRHEPMPKSMVGIYKVARETGLVR